MQTKIAIAQTEAQPFLTFRLRGAELHSVDLPQIVVIAKQSAYFVEKEPRILEEKSVYKRLCRRKPWRIYTRQQNGYDAQIRPSFSIPRTGTCNSCYCAYA